MKKLLKLIGKKYNEIIYNMFARKGKINNYIVFESEGDMSDNAYAFYDYLLKEGYGEKYRFIWLVDRPEKFKGTSHTEFYKKYSDKPNFKRTYIMATAAYFIYDHNNVYFWKKRNPKQKIVNLWHGSPIKAKGAPKTLNEWMDIVCTSSPLFIESMANFVGCDKEKVMDFGFPRTDYFYTDNKALVQSFLQKQGIKDYKKLFIWMPTFRKSKNAELSEEYFANETGLPLLDTKEKFEEFSKLCESLGIVCIIKIHHLQAESAFFKSKFNNILFLTDEIINDSGIQLYQLVSETDALITDYSSISTDYLLLDRPIIYIVDDYEMYKESRGFVFDDVLKLFPGYHIVNEEQLNEAINETASGTDSYSDTRLKVQKQMNTYSDGCVCKRIVDYLKL